VVGSAVSTQRGALESATGAARGTLWSAIASRTGVPAVSGVSGVRKTTQCGALAEPTIFVPRADELELTAVLMVTKYRGMAGRPRLREENECRHALARFDCVRDFLAHDVTQVGALNALGREWRSRHRHCAEQSQEVRPIQSFLR